MLHICKHCGIKKETSTSLSGHSFWCLKNPKRIQNAISNQNSKILERIEITKRCLKCQKEFIIFRSKKKTGEMHISTKERKYCSRRCANSKTQTPEIKEKIRKKLQGIISRTGENAHVDIILQCKYCCNLFKKSWSQRNTKFCSKECLSKSPSRYSPKGVKLSIKTKLKISLHNKGGRCKWYLVDGQKVQGTWERDVAMSLSKNNIEWIKCSNKRYSMIYLISEKEKVYIPDFYLPEYDIYLEIKGYWWSGSKEKMKNILEQHKNKNIVIIEKENIKSFIDAPLVQLERMPVFETEDESSNLSRGT